MPNPIKALDNMSKHLTRSERAARQEAERSITRETRVQIRCPDWLDQDARQVFEETKRKLRGLNLLDTSDAAILAVYSDAYSKYMAESSSLGDHPSKDDRESLRSWARLIKGYAADLGLTPNARARLAKKKAEERPKSRMAQLLSEGRDILLSGEDQGGPDE